MERFLDNIDDRYGGVLTLLADNGVGPEAVDRLTTLLITHDDTIPEDTTCR